MIKRYDHETDLLARTNQYANTVNDAIKNPTRNLQNIYFGIIMGLSAMIPTSIHFSMFCTYLNIAKIEIFVKYQKYRKSMVRFQVFEKIDTFF